MPRRLIPFVLLLAGLSSGASASETPFEPRPEVRAFIDEMVERHGFDREALDRVLGAAKHSKRVLAAIGAPGTARPWREFRPGFVNEQRIQGGVKFWNRHAEALARARETYGVPEEIVVAVVGIETLYGSRTGGFRVLDALATLAFDYPRRAEFFRGELEEFLLLSRDIGEEVLASRGSYAGAIGIPQFMPSSVRRYAVDFDGDGRPDLWRNPVDAIGSVANYLRAFGWQAGSPVAVRARVSGDAWREALDGGLLPRSPPEALRELGIEPEEPAGEGLPAAVLELDGAAGPEQWLGFNNFYVITRYNRSVNYAMAVRELAEEIRRAREARSR